MSVSHAVRLFVETHESDGLLYMDCPECGKHNKLMIGTADEGGHFYKCLSAGCGTFGTTHTTKVPGEGTKIPKSTRRTYKPYVEEMDYHPPDQSVVGTLTRGFSMREREARRLYSGQIIGHRYVYPVYAPNGQERGYVARGYKGQHPKSLLRPYYDIPVPLVSWYFPESYVPGAVPAVCVVEDQVSASKLSEFFPTVALLGTSIGLEDAKEIKEVARNLTAERICVILDNDAQSYALGLATKFPNGVPIPIFHEDVKDMSRDTFTELVEVIRGR